MNDNLFDEIDKYKKDFPKIDKDLDYIKKYEFNFYQKFAIFLELVFIFIGIILGNVFPACQQNGIYNSVCKSFNFNILLAIITWFVGFIIALFIFGLGHIIILLNMLNHKNK